MRLPRTATLQVCCLAHHRPVDVTDPVKTGSRKEKPLKQANAYRLQPAPLFEGFDALGDDRNAQILAAADHRGDNRLFSATDMNIAHQLCIYFDFIRLKAGQ